MTDLVSVFMMAVSMCSVETQEKFTEFGETSPSAPEILEYIKTKLDPNAIAYLQEQEFESRVMAGLLQ